MFGRKALDCIQFFFRREVQCTDHEEVARVCSRCANLGVTMELDNLWMLLKSKAQVLWVPQFALISRRGPGRVSCPKDPGTLLRRGRTVYNKGFYPQKPCFVSGADPQWVIENPYNFTLRTT